MAVFISAGTVVTVPLVLNFLLSTLVLPAMTPDASSLAGIMHNCSSFVWLYYNLPMVYTLLYLVIIFVFAGLFSCTALAVSRWMNYGFLVLLTPFALYMFFSSLFSLLGAAAWQPMEIVAPHFSGDARLPLLVYGICLLVVTVFGFVHKGIKDDIF